MVLEREFQANFFNERRNSSTNLEEINGDLPEADFLGTWDPFDDHSTPADFPLLIVVSGVRSLSSG